MLGSNQLREVSSDAPSKCGALANSIFCSVCIAPLMILMGLYLTGWNEKHTVCSMHAIDDGYAAVSEVKCSGSATVNGLALFACPIEKEGLQLTDSWTGADQLASFMPVKYEGAGLRVEVSMFQCVERVNQRTETRTNNDGSKSTVTIEDYTYSKEYASSYVDSTKFRGPNSMQQCGTSNPQWPVGVPSTATVYAPVVKVGEYSLSKEYIEMIPLATPVAPTKIASHWKKVGMEYHSSQYEMNQQKHGVLALGEMKVMFYGNSWDPVTVLGHEKGKSISKWHAPAAWLCSGFSLGSLRTGALDKKVLFKTLHEENAVMTNLLRVVAFCLLWGAFFSLVAPLGVLADFMPFIGGCLSDMIDCAMCCAACAPATACFCVIAGVVWVVMRPLIGGPMLFITIAIIGFMGYMRSIRAPAGSEPLNKGNGQE
mmetsp:Transcript_91682/g.294702  ORF Transcript_91682/g.294702 Transcript_91682/m.294702 type:complete len:427 (+) Transcript_91682:108-1388(+)